MTGKDWAEAARTFGLAGLLLTMIATMCAVLYIAAEVF